MEVDREAWKTEIMAHEELFSRMYDKLPKEYFFMRELLLSSLWRSPEHWYLEGETVKSQGKYNAEVFLSTKWLLTILLLHISMIIRAQIPDFSTFPVYQGEDLGLTLFNGKVSVQGLCPI